jgi:cation:H+ antiporter
VVALISGGGDSDSVQVAIGAIIGAPFVLGTLAMLVIAASALAFCGRCSQGTDLKTDNASTRRDLTAFLILFPVGILIGALDTSGAVQLAAHALLLAGYRV